ncbi:DMT family transporter [Frigidibacter mobilis]|uniref:Drug/metabolite exporter family protein n=1 Tax=Frigidibacter mobilis TaxID=1335048 RepID=A0A159Z3N4_9RHOB|nr:DMT family transporter [Frigidibacter mobilis]AMY69705.1 drug/metabolite exporter family protein [Frigidibacter mobilis]
MMKQTSISPLAWALMALLALIWGGSFPSNRLALAEVGVLTTVAFRVALGALLMWGVVALRGITRPRGLRVWAGFLGMGLLNNALPFTLIVWGQTRIDSGLAAILNAATAVLGVAVAAAVFRDERLGLRKGAGVLLGFTGVAVAIGIGALARFDPGSLGQLAVLGAALSYAFAGALGRVTTRGMAPELAAAGMLTAAALVMVPAALLVEGPPPLHLAPATWGALAYLAVFATAGAYVLYYRVMQLAGAGNLSLVTLLVAPVAIVIGAVMFHEALPLRAYLGFALLAAGLIVIDGRALRYWRPAQKSRDPAAGQG